MDNISITISSNVGGETYTIEDSSFDLSNLPLPPGDYTVTLTGQDSLGTFSDTVEFNFTVRFVDIAINFQPDSETVPEPHLRLES